MKNFLPASLIPAVDSIASKIIRIARSCVLPGILYAMLLAGFAGDVKAQSTAGLPTLSYNAFNAYEAGKYFGNFFPESSNVTAPGFAASVVSVATVAGPAKMVVDTAGNKYFQGAAINELYKYPADGSAAITITHPYQKIIDLAINKDGDLYGVAADGTVFKLPAGSTNVQTIIAGGASIGGIAIDSKGQIYLSKKAEGSIDRYAADGTYIDSPLSGLDAPAALVTDASDVLYISSNYDKIIKYTPGYAFPQNFGSSTFSPVSMSVDPAGYIYAVNSNHSVYRLKPDGSEEQLIYTDPLGQLSTFTLDSKGNAYWGTLDQTNFYTSKPSGGYYVNKPLPAGITFDVSTGGIGGKPNAVSPLNNYTVTAYGDTIAATSTFAIKVTSGDAYLASITADSASIEFPYIENQDLLSRVPSGLAALNVTPVTRDITSVITYNGNTYASGATLNIPLNVGDNLVTLLVTATGGTTREYSLTIKKPAPPSISYGNVNPLALNQYVYLLPSGSIPQAFNDFQPYGSQPIFGSAVGSKLPKMVADTAGNRYIASPAQQQIYKYGPNGDTYTTISTAPEIGIIDLAVDRAGNLYGLSDASIFKVPAGSTTMQIIAAAPAKNALAVDLDGNIFVADSLNKKIIRYDAASAVAADFVSTGDNGPVALAFNGNDQLFVAYNTESGSNILSIPVTGGSLSGIMQQYYPAALAVSPSGVLYVTTSNRIFTFYASPFPTYASVLYNTDAINAKNIGIDAKGIGYVADSKTASYRKLTPKAGFYLNKPLPKGLTFNMNNGIIMGAPTEQFTPSAYTVTAYNNGEVAATTFTLSTQAAAPGLSAIYASVGTVSPRVSPDVTEYTISVDAGTTQTELIFKTADGDSRITVNGDPIPDRGPYIVALNGADQVLAVQVTPAGGGKGMRYKVTVHAPSSESRLGNIALKDGTLTPAFDKDVTTYEVNLPASVTNTSINASLLASTGKITINGMDATSGSPFRLSLKGGINPVMITGVAEDNNTQTTYTVNITRASSATGPALSSFSSSAGTLSPAFNPDVTSYTLNLANAESILSFTLGLADAGSVITVGGDTIPANTPTFPVIVPVGTINYTATITAADGSTRTYTIAVTRAATSPESRLAGIDINVGSLSPGFDKDITNYTVYLSADMDNVYIASTLIDPNGTVTINGTQTDNGTQSANFTLNAGDNLFTISGISADGSSQTNYKVNIIRGGEGPASALKGIATSSGTLNPSFDPNNRYYNLETDPEAASITITPTTKDPLSLAYVNAESADGDSGPKTIALSVGDNAIPIFVKSADGSSTSIYSLSVNRPVAITSLGMGTGTLSPAYNYNMTSYNVNVPPGTTTLSLKPLANSDMGGYIINGVFVYPNAEPYAVPLNTNGTTTITIVGLKLDDNSTPTYTLNVEQNSGISTLAGIILSEGSLSAFASATLNYTTNVVTSSSVTLSPVLTDANATLAVTLNGTPVTAAGGVFTLPLIDGDNAVLIKVTAQDGATTKTYSITVPHTPASTVATLTDLQVTSAAIVFSSGTTSYSATTNAGQVAVKAMLTDPKAKLEINNNSNASGSYSSLIDLSLGTNTIVVKVTAEDGTTTKTYTVTVTRTVSSIADLSALSTSAGSLSPATFNKDVLSYSVPASVPYATNSATITASTANQYAILTVNNISTSSGVASAPVVLAVGANTIPVQVTAQDGTSSKAYAVTITRNAASNVATLSAISISAGSLTKIATGPANHNYIASVPYTTTTTTITAVPTQSAALIKLRNNSLAAGVASGPITLVPGDNIIDLLITAENGTTIRTYQVVITRAKSTDANLAALGLSKGELNPKFSSAVTSYAVGIAEPTVNLTPTVSDTSARVTVNGVATTSGQPSAEFNLASGQNIIPVVVTAGNGNTKTYTVTVTRTLSPVADLSALSISGGTLSPLPFDKDVLRYNAMAPGSTASITVTATLADAKATLKVSGIATASNTASVPVTLAFGLNTIPVAVTAEDGTLKTYIISVARIAPSLADLSIPGGTISPQFDKDSTAYTATTNQSQIGIIATANADEIIKVNGVETASGQKSAAINLAAGENIIPIEVGFATGGSKTYTVTVTRTLSPVADLSALSISGGTLSPLSFDKDVLSYTATTLASSIRVTAGLVEDNATMTINGVPASDNSASAPVSLAFGSNTIPVVVTAQNGLNTKTYTLIITRRPPSSVATLSGIGISAAKLTKVTGPANHNYVASVPNTVTSTTLKAVASDATATITLNGASIGSGIATDPIMLNVGDNVLEVLVTAEDGVTTRSYRITLTRAKSNIATLAAISSSAGKLVKVASGPANFNYTLSVPYSTALATVTPTATDNGATVKVNGADVASGTPSAPVALDSGDNVIDLLVTAADGVATRSYQIIITRAKSNIATLAAISSSAGKLVKLASGPANHNYTVSTPYSVSLATITATATDNGATIKVNGTYVASTIPSAPVTLITGYNVIDILVTAADGVATRTYQITITRAKSNIATLSTITSSAGKLTKITSGPANHNYTSTVGYSTTSTVLTLKPTDADATVSVSGSLVSAVGGIISQTINLVVGANMVDMLVMAPDGVTTRTYQVVITRSGPPVIASAAPDKNPIDVLQKTEAVVTDGLPEMVVKQALSPNGDGINDRFTIQGINAFPDNTVRVMDRNGNVIYQAKGYDNMAQSFDGRSSGGTLQQPGTYFYSIEYKSGDTIRHKSGYLVIKY